MGELTGPKANALLHFESIVNTKTFHTPITVDEQLFKDIRSVASCRKNKGAKEQKTKELLLKAIMHKKMKKQVTNIIAQRMEQGLFISCLELIGWPK